MHRLYLNYLKKSSFHILKRTCHHFRHKNVTPVFIEEIENLIGKKKISTSYTLRNQCGTDEGYHGTSPSDVVVFPESLGDIVAITKLCSSTSVPIIPRGSGTGLEHGVGALIGGVCIDLSKMVSITEVNEEDFDCTVEAGVTRKTLNSHLRHTGLMFPVDPGADATLGGMVSTSASGTTTVRYGTMKENVLNLEIVLPNGDVFHTAGPDRRARKSSAGYNLTELFIGAEGTLGIISKITLRLHPQPEMMVSAISSFSSVGNAVDAVVQILQRNVPVARVELLDELSMNIVNKYHNLDYPSDPTLFFEFHGSEESVKEQADQVGDIVRSNSGYNFKWASDVEERKKLWEARHQFYYAALAQRPGYKCVTTDVCVPISKLTEIITETKQDLQNSGLLTAVLGHVGDGNFHTLIMYDPLNQLEEKIAHELENKISLRALSLNGTCTGEHGIGIGKMPFLIQEYGTVGIEVMKNIKRSIDPHNLMNPGKVIDMS